MRSELVVVVVSFSFICFFSASLFLFSSLILWSLSCFERIVS